MWISGCATGEEAYPFAILLLKAAARHRLRPAIQVFGSDLDSIFYTGQVETDRQLAEGGIPHPCQAGPRQRDRRRHRAVLRDVPAERT
jgi:hypothetical protein